MNPASLPTILQMRPTTNGQGPRYSWSAAFSWTFAFCAAIGLVSGVGLIIGVKRIFDSDRFERHTFDVVGRVEEARSSLRSAVSNMREYMLTGDQANQQAYLADCDLTHTQLDQYSDLLGDSPEAGIELQKLNSHLNSLTALMNSAMAGRAELGGNAAPKLSEDPQLTNQIGTMETDLGSQISLHNNQLDVHRDTRHDDLMLTEIAFACTMFFGSFTLALAAIGVRTEIARRESAEARHASARQDLLTAHAMLELSDQKDPETGLLNRDAFDQILEQEYATAFKDKSTLSIVLMDLDQFAQIREVKGQETCEMVLKQAAALIKDSFRGGDVLCRFSDSEFAVIMPRTPLQHATTAAERARSSVERKDWPNCNITASLGVAQADFLKDHKELVNRAEQAVDYARRTGHNRVTAIRAYLPLSA